MLATLAGIFVLVFAGRVHAQSAIGWSGEDANDGLTYTDPSALAVVSCNFAVASFGGPSKASCSPSPGTCASPPTVIPSSCLTTASYSVFANGATGNAGSAMHAVACTGTACPPTSCAGLPSVDILAAISASSFNSGGLICVAGCGYTNSASSMHIAVGTSSAALVGRAVATGAQCSSGASTVAALSTSNCMESGGTTVCHQSAANVATVNNDIVNPAAAPLPGQCAAYADGAVECNRGTGGTLSVIAGPTTGGALMAPAVVVTTSSDVVDYFSPTQVNASQTPVASVNGGNITGNPAGNGPTGPCTPTAPGVTPVVTCMGSSTGAGSGTGTGTGTAGSGPGDCMLQPGEAGSDDPSTCAGTTPSLTRTDTVQSNIQGLYNGIKASPIMSALGAISSSVPAAGACPTASVSLISLGSHTFDFLQTACTIFASDLSTLVAISDTIWAILGVLIVMSA